MTTVIETRELRAARSAAKLLNRAESNVFKAEREAASTRTRMKHALLALLKENPASINEGWVTHWVLNLQVTKQCTFWDLYRGQLENLGIRRLSSGEFVSGVSRESRFK